MIKWLWKQKMRFDKGLSLFPLMNFLLLLATASDKLKIFFPFSTGGIVLFFFPTALCCVWLFGYVLTKPAMQRHEDDALDDLMPMRREIREINTRLKEY